MSRKFPNLVFFLILFRSLTLYGAEIFKDQKSCVAWKTKSTSFLFFEKEVIGINCAISSKISAFDEYQKIEINIPVAKFDSGDETRDAKFNSFLSIKDEKTFKVVTIPTPKELWRQWLKLGRGILRVELHFSERVQKIDVITQFDKINDNNYLIKGIWKGRFTDLGVNPPKYFYGLFAYADEFLELHFQISSKDIVGFEGAIVGDH